MEVKNEIVSIKRLGEEISQVHRSGVLNSDEIISKYLDWRVRIEELCDNYFLTEPDFVTEFKKFNKARNGFYLIGKYFPVQLPISHRIFREIEKPTKKIDDVYSEKTTLIQNASEIKVNKLGKIFISHNSMDRVLADDFMNIFISSSKLSREDFICASLPGSKLESGKTWTKDIIDNVENCSCFIGLITNNFLESEVSFWETGLAHGFKKRIFFLLTPPISTKNCGNFFNTFHLDSIQNSDDLDQLKDFIENEKDIKITTSIWNNSKNLFLKKIKN